MSKIGIITISVKIGDDLPVIGLEGQAYGARGLDIVVKPIEILALEWNTTRGEIYVRVRCEYRINRPGLKIVSDKEESV